MTSKYLISLLTSSILVCSISPVWAQDNTSSGITFACEENNGTPITVAKNKEGKTETIFYWKKEALAYKTPSTPQEICNDVSSKLNEFAQEYDLSSFILIPTEYSGLPIICVGDRDNYFDCKKVLFTLLGSSTLITADFVLQEILNSEIIINKRDLCDIRDCGSIVSFKVSLFKNK